MTLEKEYVKKKLKKMKENFPNMDVEQIEKELYPMQGDQILPKTVKKKKEDD